MRRRIAYASIALILITLFAMRECALWPDSHTHLLFLSVGQGDSTLIKTVHGKKILIDGGPDWSTLEALGRQLPFFDRSIDLLILSHANLDHLASFPEILERYHVAVIAVSDIAVDTPWFLRITDTARKVGTTILPLHAGQAVTLDDTLIASVLWPPKKLPLTYAKELNNTSLVLKISDGEHAALFTGDMEERVESTLVLAKAAIKADILKVPHHGSKTSSSTGFLLAVGPSTAIISVGQNSYGHPNPGVLQRYKALGIETRRTDNEGDIEVVW